MSHPQVQSTLRQLLTEVSVGYQASDDLLWLGF